MDIFKEFLKEFAYNVIDNKLSFSEAIKILSGNRKLTDLEIKKLEPSDSFLKQLSKKAN